MNFLNDNKPALIIIINHAMAQKLYAGNAKPERQLPELTREVESLAARIETMRDQLVDGLAFDLEDIYGNLMPGFGGLR